MKGDPAAATSHPGNRREGGGAKRGNVNADLSRRTGMFALDPELLHPTGLDRKTERAADEWRGSQPEEQTAPNLSLRFASLSFILTSGVLDFIKINKTDLNIPPFYNIHL